MFGARRILVVAAFYAFCLRHVSAFTVTSARGGSQQGLISRNSRRKSQKNSRSLHTTTLYASSSSGTGSSLKLPSLDDGTKKSVVSASTFLLIDFFFRKAFLKASISFPSSLGACGVLFATLLAIPTSTKFYESLQPGAALLAKWLPVFFVPSLVTLPLADSIGSSVEVLKIGSVIVGGFLLTLLASAYSVVGIRKLMGTTVTETTENAVTKGASASPAKKPFSDETFNLLALMTISSGIAALATSTGIASTLAGPLTSIFMLSTTLTGFVFGARLPKSFNKLVHPLITCTGVTWAMATAFAKITGKTFIDMLHSYRKGGLNGIHTGAGDVLLYLLGPAVVSLAISMYERRKLMRDNLAEVATSIACSTASGLFVTALAVRCLGIVSPYLRLSLLSRNITTPLAMAIAGILGADVSLAVSFVVVTGLLGANFGASILNAFGVKDAVARGLGIGASAHGLGTAAFANEPDAFPFAAISMALTATAATVAVSIPAIRSLLLQLALG